MTLELLLANLAAYSAQIAALVIVGSALPYALRMRRPGAMLLYRQALLFLCLALPLLQPWKKPVIRSLAFEPPAGEVIAPVPPLPPAAPEVPAEALIAGALAAGFLARLAWLAIGLARLGRYRRRATGLEPLPVFFHDLQTGFGVRPLVAVSADISAPVTFGFARPVILLPERFLALPEAAQRAIAFHEMIHVRRGDWIVTICEELARAVFWFHPCVWWLLAQIHLTREQVVDAEAIDLTSAPGDYVDTLLAVAGARLQPDLAPAPLFLRRRHLKQRVASILEGASMSRQRLISSFAAVCGALVIAVRFAALYFPMSAPAQKIVVGEAGLLHRTAVTYPREAIEKRVEGTVVVLATLNERGIVTDARVVSGPELLKKAALRSVLEWHYAPRTQSPVQIAVEFRLPETAAAPAATARRPSNVAPPHAIAGGLSAIQFSGVPSALMDSVAARLRDLSVQAGSNIDAQALEALRQELQAIDEHLEARLLARPKSDGTQEIALTIFSTAPIEAPAPDAPQRIRVGGAVQAAKLIHAPQPEYPPLARQARLQGVVRLAITISKEGKVIDIRAESGHPILVPAAIEAVKFYEYEPTLLNGNPVEVVTVADVSFRLDE